LSTKWKEVKVNQRQSAQEKHSELLRLGRCLGEVDGLGRDPDSRKKQVTWYNQGGTDACAGNELGGGGGVFYAKFPRSKHPSQNEDGKRGL